MIDATMTVYAGADDEICEGMDYETNASAQNYESVMWETSGSGNFDDNTSMEAVYTPSQQDWEDGMVTLSITVYGNGDSMTDEMELTFMPMPDDAGAITGIAMVCAGWSETYMIDELNDADWYHWVISPEEAGMIDSTAHEVTIHWAENYTGNAVLTVQGMNDCGEGVFSEDFTVTVDACTGINEMSATEISLSPNPGNGQFVIQTQITEGTLEIIDLSGKVVYTQEFNHQNTTINASSLYDGMYFIKLHNQTSIAVEKLIIRK